MRFACLNAKLRDMIKPFVFASTPHIRFGCGVRRELADVLAAFGRKVLLVTGSGSIDRLPMAAELFASLAAAFELRRLRVGGEPSPELVDAAVREHRSWQPDVVLAIGGGSAVDAAKAIAGLLPGGDSVMCYLEGVGEGKRYSGPSTPFVAMPTTAGTGGETSKNAVLSVIGPSGFKKSFRDEQLVAHTILLDPELTVSCPPAVTAACGMDALTQLLESYASCKANAMTDALCESGLRAAAQALPAVYHQGQDLEARSAMLYASSISGLTLANAGLGSVHGLASPLGAFFPIPHGVACAALLAEALALNIRALRQRQPESSSLMKYAQAGRILTGVQEMSVAAACEALVNHLRGLAEEMQIPRLCEYGIGEDDIPRLIEHISGGSMSGNPLELERHELEELIRRCL